MVGTNTVMVALWIAHVLDELEAGRTPISLFLPG